jgi:hypothetical protein
MKRIVLGLCAAGALALTAAPATASVTIQRCYATVLYPCGVCVSEGPVDQCTHD